MIVVVDSSPLIALSKVNLLFISSLSSAHTLKIRMQGYREYSTAVGLEAGKRIAITLEME